MAFSKIRLNGTVLMDVTSTTAVEADVNYPKLFTKADGVQASGTNTGDTPVVFIQDENGYIILDEGAIVQPEAEWNDVCFWDYDGKCLYSYSASEFAELTEMPNNPTHKGLTAQGWNWSLSGAKAHVAEYGILDIGQLYVTSDKKTRLYIDITEVKDVSLRLKSSVSGGTTIDWGDSSETTATSGTADAEYTHTYADSGSYVISLEATYGTITLGTGTNYLDLFGQRQGGDTTKLKRVEMGEHAIIATNCFNYMLKLETITFAQDTVINGGLNNTGIKALIFPSAYGNGTGSTDRKGANGMFSLKVFSLANQSFFNADYGAFGTANSLRRICVPIGYGAVQNQILVNSQSIEEFIWSDAATQLSNQGFSSLSSLKKVTIGSGLTTFQNSMFTDVYSLVEVHMKATTPPALGGTSVFTNCPSDFVIYVPYSADHSVLTAYQTATNWSTFAARMQEESQGGA